MNHVIPYMQDSIAYEEDPAFGSRVVRITITKHCSDYLHGKFRRNLKRISFCKFAYDLVDMKGNKSSENMLPLPNALVTTNKLVGAINAVEMAMRKYNYRLRKGFMYRKVSYVFMNETFSRKVHQKLTS